jgi:hypothetical protein
VVAHRGIELAAARACHMWTDSESLTVSWSLPVSKTDPKGMCTTRTHGCCCKLHIEPICPYHTARRHLWHLHRTFGKDFQSSERDVPLFPNQHGQYMSHIEVTKTIQDIIALTGEAMTRPGIDGRPLPRFAEHVLRVSGAQMMARGGMDLYFIQLMGRWGSNAIERYVQDAYLLDQQNIALAITDKLDGRQSQNRAEICDNLQFVKSATQDSMLKDIQDLKETLGIMQAKLDTKTLILNPKSRLIHIPNMSEERTPSSTWRTRCGWAYGTQLFCRVTCLPDGASNCSRCWKDEPVNDHESIEQETHEPSESSEED